ncbi:MAG: PIN domain-containing protein [Candidatus Diapherotrites archaeon]
MDVTPYFFDTYAFFEIIEGNKNYKKFSEGIALITTKMNLMELYYGLAVSYGKKTAKKYFDKYQEYCIPISFDLIEKAMDFRLENKGRKLSYADCVGYVLAKDLGARFLTGDKEFKEMANVEFVK